MELELEEGSIVEGKVMKIKPYGALVQLPGNAQGLVHISHISPSFVQNAEDFISVGDTVTVKILSADTKTNKYSLSIKEAAAESQPEDVGAEQSKDATFEEKFKEYVKSSNERLASLNKRNKKR
jgi:predicted RNA-binding protein with RPS1 domain